MTLQTRSNSEHGPRFSGAPPLTPKLPLQPEWFTHFPAGSCLRDNGEVLDPDGKSTYSAAYVAYWGGTAIRPPPG